MDTAQSALIGNRAWFPAELDDQGRWIHTLSAAEIADIADALAAAKKDGLTFETLTRENFHLKVLPESLSKTLHVLEHDLGLYVLRGLPVRDYTKDELRLIYWGVGLWGVGLWGVGLHLGTPLSQSSKGDVLGDLKNFGSKVHSATGRGYMSRERLGYHTDTADVVALFVLQTAKSGGLSMFCSSLAIRDEIAKTRPRSRRWS